ncbi:MAG: head decoration protein [Pseudomonadota bacterium]
MPLNAKSGKKPWAFLISVANGQRSYGQGLLDNSQSVQPGQPLGLITATSRLVAMDPTAGDGSENFAGLAGGFEGDIVTSATETKDIAMLVGDAEVNEFEIVFPDTWTDPQIAAAKTQMGTAGIKLVGASVASGNAL